ncbi:MAG: hypothetical protein QXM96_03345, partial [Candidatus Woesearchaeota archaeon]
MFKEKIDNCIKNSVIEAEKKYGFNKITSDQKIKKFVETNLPICIDFKSYEEKGFSVFKSEPIVNIKITNEALIANVYYKILLKKDNLKLSHENSIYTYPRTVLEKLNKNSETIVSSTDGKIRIEISPGTEVTLNGNPVNAVGIKQLDRNFNALNNGVLMGMTAYNGLPHGAVFSKPVKIYYYYEDWEIPPFIKEEDLKVGYYPDDLGIWIGLPTKVDPVNNVLMVETKHFSIYGSVVKCGSENVLNQIITPVLIREGCRDCNEWKYVENFNSENPIYPGQLYKESTKVLKKEGTKELEDVTYLNNGECTVDEITTIAKDSSGNEISSDFFFSSGSNCMDFSKECSEINENKDKCSVQRCVCDLYPNDASKGEDEKRYEFLDFADGTEGLITQFDSNNVKFDNGKSSTTINGKDFSDVNALKSFLDLVNKLSQNKKFITSSDENLKGSCDNGQIIKIENVKYDNNYLYFCGLESCAYEKYDDLKARQVYEVHFKGLGDSCIAQAVEKKEDEKSEIDAGEGIGYYLNQDTTNSETETKKEETVSINYKLKKQENIEKNSKNIPTPQVIKIDSITGNLINSENKESEYNLIIDITPICYDDDDCEILNAHFKKFKSGDTCQKNDENDDCSTDIILEFTVESKNSK